MVSHQSKQFPCHICTKVFQSSQGRLDHIRRFHEKVFQCDFCDKVYSIKVYFDNHLWMQHNIGSANHICHICSRSYTSIRYLGLHIKNCHAKSFDFKCNQCVEKFRMKHQLEKHNKRFHSDNEKKFNELQGKKATEFFTAEDLNNDVNY